MMRSELLKGFGDESTLFYRSRFEVFPDADINAEIWPQIVGTLQRWLEEKEGKRQARSGQSLLADLTADTENYSRHFAETYEDCYLSTRFASGNFTSECSLSFLETAAEVGAAEPFAPQFWAMDYLEGDTGLWYRRWQTHVGVTSSCTGSYVVNVRVSFLDDPAYMSAQPEVPSRNTPRFIGGMLDIANCIALTGDLKLVSDPVDLTEGNFDEFLDELTSATRVVPLVVVSPYWDCDSRTDEGYILDPDRLQRKMRGSAVVYKLDRSDYDFRRRYWSIFKKGSAAYQYRVGNGFARIFFPGVDLGDEKGAIRHRFYTSDDLRTCDLGQVSDDVCGAITRLYQMRASEVLNPASVRIQADRRKREELTRRFQEFERDREAVSAPTVDVAATDEAVEAKRAVSSLQKNLARKEEENAFYLEYIQAIEQDVQRLDVLQAQVDRSERTIDALQYQLRNSEDARNRLRADARAAQEASEAFLGLNAFPRSPLDSLEFAERAFASRLVVMDEAKQSAKEFTAGDADEVYRLLRSMAICLWDLYFNGVKKGSIDQAFRSETGFELSLRESSTTNKDPRLARIRTRRYQGREIDITPHVKGASNAFDKALRVHYWKDDDSKKLVIGHCGVHLDTAGTRRKK